MKKKNLLLGMMLAVGLGVAGCGTSNHSKTTRVEQRKQKMLLIKQLLKQTLTRKNQKLLKLRQSQQMEQLKSQNRKQKKLPSKMHRLLRQM